MAARCIQYLLLLFLMEAPYRTLVQNLHCEVSTNLRLEDDPGRTFNWTSKTESCNPGDFCQETVLLIKAEGTKTLVLASKSCIAVDMESITFIQYTSGQDLVAISYSNYCNETICNNKSSLSSFWKPPETKATSSTVGALHCPTCVALGVCHNATSQPCPNSTTQCYQGRLEFSGGGMDSMVQVKGCTSVIGCRLMAGLTSVGPMTVKETCNYHSFLQPRKAENGASRMYTSVWVLEQLMPALLLSLTHFP